MPSAPPNTRPITGAHRPTVSEIRAPWISRESSSRPSVSVPSQCAAENGARRASISMSVGLGSGSTPASAAAASTSRVQPAAIQNSVPSRRVRLTGLTTMASSISSSSVAMADPGIENGVEQIDHEIHQHVAASHEQHHALQDDEVAGVDRAQQQPADAGQREHGFDDHGAADQP